MDLVVGKGLPLINSCFKIRKSRLTKFQLDDTEGVIDYILVNNR